MKNLFFYLPVMYRVHTREKGKFLIPFLINDFLPALLICFASDEYTFYNLSLYIVSFMAMFICYEIGYILNDGVTALREDKPTVRLTEQELQYFHKKDFLIFSCRIIEFLVLAMVVHFYYEKKLTCILAGNIILILIYLLHNYYRNLITVLTNFSMNVIKYILPIMFFYSNEKIMSFVMLFIMFPVGRGITYYVEKFGKDKIEIHLFQFIYYLIFTICYFFLFRYYSFTMISMIYVFIFLTYRLLMLLAIKIRKK